MCGGGVVRVLEDGLGGCLRAWMRERARDVSNHRDVSVQVRNTVIQKRRKLIALQEELAWVGVGGVWIHHENTHPQHPFSPLDSIRRN